MSTKSNVRRALLMDAYSQVLDNRVFRILSVLAGVSVALTFAIGFREDSIWILGGWREYFYDDVFSMFGIQLPVGGQEQQEMAISIFQAFFSDFLGGTMGMFFCVGATTFFVPRLLEKGFADSFFSKPVSRWALLLSRYVAGLIFIALLASLLIGGMHLGFVVSSEYSDPTFLWSIPTLVYLFALVSSFSILFGVLTRSTVASLLLTFVAYGITTGIHTAWMGIEFLHTNGDYEEILEESREGSEDALAASVLLTGMDVVSGLHYVLPKTVDAKFITADLRDQIVTDEASQQTIITVDSETGERTTETIQRENPFSYYESQLGWSSPWKFNFWFSILSSLAFIAFTLQLAWLRLRRISF